MLTPFPAKALKADFSTQTDCHWNVTEYVCEAT